MYFRHKCALTLIELSVSLLIALIVLGLAFIGFRDVTQNSKANAASDSFHNALHYARAEAIRRNLPVSICPAANQNFQACGNSAAWTNGWIIFIDPNNTGSITAAGNRLAIEDALPTGTQITTSIRRIIYTGTGRASAVGGTRLLIAATGCVGQNAMQFALTAAGRFDVSAQSC